MDRPRLKLVTMKPPKKVPADAKPIREAVDEIIADAVGGVRKSPQVEQIMASIERIERMMLHFSKDLNDLGSSIDYTEARLNRVVRLTKTLATIAGIPD